MIILRKAQQKVRIFHLKDITKGLKTINKRITEKIEENELAGNEEMVEELKKD